MTISGTAWTKQINENGYRLTGPRLAIVEIVSASQHALSAAEIFVEARKRYPGLGLVTVYRTLDKLEQMKLIEKVHHENDCHTFIAHREGHQHILICGKCSRVEYFSGDDISGLIETVSHKSGFQVQEHWLQLVGLCPACQETL